MAQEMPLEDLTLDNLTWMDVERYLLKDDRLVLTIGSCEQHAYLSLATDARVPMAIAREACCRSGVLAAPALPFGISPYFMAYPGTISLRPETLAAIMRDMIESALAHGFRRIVLNNGHGGNTGVLTAIAIEIGNAHPEAKLSLFHWWQHPAVAAIATKAGYPQFHANWSESFAASRVGPLPEGSKPAVDLPLATSARTTRDLMGDGSFGGPYQAPQELTDRLFAAAVDTLVEELATI